MPLCQKQKGFNVASRQKSPGWSGASGYEQYNASTENIAGKFGKNNYQPAFEFTSHEAASVEYGIVALRLHIEAGRLVRYTVTKEQSFLAGGTSKAPVRT
jgi:hypothetical protein